MNYTLSYEPETQKMYIDGEHVNPEELTEFLSQKWKNEKLKKIHVLVCKGCGPVVGENHCEIDRCQRSMNDDDRHKMLSIVDVIAPVDDYMTTTERITYTINVLTEVDTIANR